MWFRLIDVLVACGPGVCVSPQGGFFVVVHEATAYQIEFVVHYAYY